MRSNKATRAETASYHKAQLKIRRKELDFKIANLGSGDGEGGGIKDQQEWLDLAQDLAKSDESSYQKAPDGSILMRMNALTGEMTRPTIDPKAFEENVRRHGSALNREHRTDFRYSAPASAAGAAPQQAGGAPVPGSGGNDDPLGLR